MFKLLARWLKEKVEVQDKKLIVIAKSKIDKDFFNAVKDFMCSIFGGNNNKDDKIFSVNIKFQNIDGVMYIIMEKLDNFSENKD